MYGFITLATRQTLAACQFRDFSDSFHARLAVLLNGGDCRQVPTRSGANGTFVTQGQRLVRMALEMKPEFLNFIRNLRIKTHLPQLY